jgi:trichoplein keratin filament-binding protein
MYAYTKQLDTSEARVEERMRSLNDRRVRLRALIDAERASHEADIRSLRAQQTSSTTPVVVVTASNLDALKSRSEALKSAREEERRKVAEQKLYENFRLNNPELRALESKKLESHVVEAWSEQMREKSEVARAEKKEHEEYLAYLEVERQRQADRDEELRRCLLY